jgi:tetrahydromethanopterin S-methyltransferase subunit B
MTEEQQNAILEHQLKSKAMDLLHNYTEIEMLYTELKSITEKVEYLEQICEELFHALTCHQSFCTLDYDGINNWKEYRSQKGAV